MARDDDGDLEELDDALSEFGGGVAEGPVGGGGEAVGAIDELIAVGAGGRPAEDLGSLVAERSEFGFELLGRVVNGSGVGPGCQEVGDLGAEGAFDSSDFSVESRDVGDVSGWGFVRGEAGQFLKAGRVSEFGCDEVPDRSFDGIGGRTRRQSHWVGPTEVGLMEHR